jgi:hypothetical protein
VVEEAAIPVRPPPARHDHRHGRRGLVVESADAARERGIRPICEVLSAVTANSAFHGTRLDVQHISQVMEDLVARRKPQRHSPSEIAPQMFSFLTKPIPPRAAAVPAAEIHALRRVFGDVRIAS